MRAWILFRLLFCVSSFTIPPFLLPFFSLEFFFLLSLLNLCLFPFYFLSLSFASVCAFPLLRSLGPASHLLVPVSIKVYGRQYNWKGFSSSTSVSSVSDIPRTFNTHSFLYKVVPSNSIVKYSTALSCICS